MTDTPFDTFQDNLASLVQKSIDEGLDKESIYEILILTAQDFCE